MIDTMMDDVDNEWSWGMIMMTDNRDDGWAWGITLIVFLIDDINGLGDTNDNAHKYLVWFGTVFPASDASLNYVLNQLRVLPG